MAPIIEAHEREKAEKEQRIKNAKVMPKEEAQEEVVKILMKCSDEGTLFHIYGPVRPSIFDLLPVSPMPRHFGHFFFRGI